jgi:hypothetical protein
MDGGNLNNLSNILSLGFLRVFQVAAQLGIATWIWGYVLIKKVFGFLLLLRLEKIERT